MMIDIDLIREDAAWMRRRVLELAFNAGSSGTHLGGSLSLIEILATLYCFVTPDTGANRDRVILSKGHGAMALYAALERHGIMSPETVNTFETPGTHLFAHASRDIGQGVEFSGGSLGLGISFGAGVALACKEAHRKNRIYIIVGDGEANEGIFWETLLAIKHYQLDNITVILDRNGLQADGPTEEVLDMEPLATKFQAFGFNTLSVDGHDIEALAKAMESCLDTGPNLIIAKTVKGKGVSFMEGVPAWHHGVLSGKKYEKAIGELNQE